MKTKTAYIQITILFFMATAWPAAVHAQHIESDLLTYQAYLTNSSSTEGAAHWKKVVSTRQKEFDENPLDKNSRFRLVLAQYGLLSATMRDKDEDLFDLFFDQTQKHLELLIKQNKNWGEPKAVLSGLLGLKMGYSPWKGMILGPKSSDLIEHALKDSPDSPLINKFYGNAKLFTPDMWGGDIKQAIQSLEKSVREYEETKTNTNNWLYLDALAFLGQAYVKNNEIDKAIRCYEKALSHEPSFGWVNFSLLPSARKKMQGN